MKFKVGDKVRTTKCNGRAKHDWYSEALAERVWNAIGTVAQASDSHGRVYQVTHKDGDWAWYEEDEFELIKRQEPATEVVKLELTYDELNVMHAMLLQAAISVGDSKPRSWANMFARIDDLIEDQVGRRNDIRLGVAQ